MNSFLRPNPQLARKYTDMIMRDSCGF